MESKHFELKLKSEIRNEFIVTAMVADYAWENGKPTDKLLGWRLKTLCPSANYSETIVKMEGEKPPLDKTTVEQGAVLVAFDDITFTPYIGRNGRSIAYSARAKALRLLKGNSAN